MNKLLSIGLLSILTIMPLVSEEPYVLETFEEETEFVPMEDTLPIVESIEEEVIELMPIEESVPLNQIETLVSEEEIVVSNEELETNMSYAKALQKTKDENKILIIAIRGTNCHYCDRMENETLNEQSVEDALSENFVTFHVDQDLEELPLGLQTGMTPNFVFVNANEDIIDMAPGLRTPVEFLEVLDRILKQPK